MTRITEDDPIKKGDKIISSGAGGVIPQGLIIGEVKSVQVSQYGQSRTATIEPAAKFDDWKYLIIVFTPEEPE